MKKLIVTGLAFLCSFAAQADNPLYETGPSQDSSFVRFLNASDNKASVVNGAAKIALGAQNETRVSRFYPVKAGNKLTASVHVGSASTTVEVVAKPGEFITIAIMNKGKSLDSMLLRESPTDFNAMRSSVALLNADASCESASLTGGSKNASILEAVKPTTVQRRLVNPVKLTVQTNCSGTAAGKPVDMSQLQAGERYSVILMNGKGGRQAFFVRDSTS
ncbi:MAG: alginate O-acetyltransferase AlgF [Burkholderiales bacterium]|nr:alginate O-acetyltransferase AlgF [Burkholderiales bacterium]